MKDILNILIILLGINFFIGCPIMPIIHTEIEPDEFENKFSLEEIEIDMNNLLKVSENVHLNLYAYGSKSNFDGWLRIFKQELTVQLIRIEPCFRVASLITCLGYCCTNVSDPLFGRLKKTIMIIYEEIIKYIFVPILIFVIGLLFRPLLILRKNSVDFLNNEIELELFYLFGIMKIHPSISLVNMFSESQEFLLAKVSFVENNTSMDPFTNKKIILRFDNELKNGAELTFKFRVETGLFYWKKIELHKTIKVDNNV